MSSPALLRQSTSAEEAGVERRAPLRVFVMDLWCIVPYYTTYLCKSLRREDVEVTLGSISYHFDPDHFQRNGLETRPGALDIVGRVQIPSATLRRGLKFVESCANMLALAARFAISRPDVIHVQFIPLIEEGLPFELWLLRLARRMGIRLVYTVHNELPMDTGERHVEKFRRVYGLMDALICHSPDAKARLEASYGVPSRKIFVIPHGPLFHDAPRPRAERARAVAGVKAGETVVLWQGWIKPYKGILFLLNAWKRVAERAPQARLVIAGRGDDALLAEIRRAVEALGVADSVRLDFRFIPVDELPCFYTAADIVVYPYKEITTSGALMTALSYGKAIVTTRLPYFEDSVGSSGAALMADYADEEQFAAALLAFIEDPALRASAGDAAARLAKSGNTEWDAIARETRRCYETVCAGCGRGRKIP